MIRVSSFGECDHSLREEYIQRIKRLIPLEWTQIPLKRCPDIRSKELLPEETKFLKENKNFWLVDEKGKGFTSQEFYEWCFSKSDDRHLVVGPAIGFHPDFLKGAQGRISLSNLTLTHGLAQTLLAEALYRSVCILKNHPFVK